MSISFADCAARVDELHRALRALDDTCQALQLPPLSSREWFQLLEQKLLPQMSDSAFLVAAVVGGTNIGKSVLFNHLAGSRASATSPLASGTKHPTCLVPRGFEQTHDLASIFPGFELVEWTGPDAALAEIDADQLFWRHCDALPDNLLALDTPDIDSDARINWERADKIRRSADVLIAVLTQQKYNDAAVKEFFRRAAAEDKFVLVVFNQVHLPDDEEYWPLWMRTFCDETGIRPEFLYLAPHDRKAAEENRLTFFERTWPIAADAASAVDGQGELAGRRLSEDLSTLHFGEIKLQTLRGSLDLLIEDNGVPGWLNEIRGRSGEFRSAAELLSTHKLAEIETWPTLPNALIVEKIRDWWQSQREGWSGAVHGFYNRIGGGMKWAYQQVQERVSGPQTPPIDTYREQEWRAIVDAVEEVYSRLNWFRELGNPLLQPRLETLLGATTRQELIDRLRAEHESCDLEWLLVDLIHGELESFRNEKPDWYRSLRQLDTVAAAARPATSIVLFVVGFGPIGNAVGQVATETALTSAVSVAGDVAAGGVTAAVGETWISSSTSSGAAWLEARFRRIHDRFIAQRAGWLAKLLQHHLLGSLPEDLAQAAVIPESEQFAQIQTVLTELQKLLESRLQAECSP
jgi:hypothetical protein